MVTLLPLTAPFFLTGRWWEKLLMLPIAPFIVNVILLCSSRGAFLGAVVSGVAFLFLAPRAVRIKAIKVVALGVVATSLLLGDPAIVERFMSIFVSGEERDASAKSRIMFAKGGLAMIEDYPLGAGGDGFKKVHAEKYLREYGYGSRALHNGYLNEACEWGVQGLMLRILFMLGTTLILWRNSRLPCTAGNEYGHLLGAALAAGLLAFLVTCLFGDFLDSEWGYWVAALGVAQSRCPVVLPQLQRASVQAPWQFRGAARLAT
jgi:O-antigen ligase